jgi:hypothetical protein
VRGVIVELVIPNDSKRWVHHDPLSGPVSQKFEGTQTAKRGRPRKSPVPAVSHPDSDDDEENDVPVKVQAASDSPAVAAPSRNDAVPPPAKPQ